MIAFFSLWPSRSHLLIPGASAQTPDPNFKLSICGDHGGVDCSVINPDASIVCKDGTIDDSFFIYGVRECQKAIETLADQQAEFMAQSGCIPPTEMICTSDQSYENLYQHLSDLGLVASELGKKELSQCRRQIEEYSVKDKEYRQCLSDNKNREFHLIGSEYSKPLLKTIFCPIFYGNNSYYDSGADICLCDAGYFMSDGECKEASSICQLEYGPASVAKNGDCSCKDGYRQNTSQAQCIPVEQTLEESPKLRGAPSSTPKISYPGTLPMPSSIIAPLPSGDEQDRLKPLFKKPDNQIKPKQNLAVKIFSGFVQSIKSLVKLFRP